MYDPKVARFLQEDDPSYSDPSDPLSLNLYTYCHNEPITYTDPTGHWDYSTFFSNVGLSNNPDAMAQILGAAHDAGESITGVVQLTGGGANQTVTNFDVPDGLNVFVDTGVTVNTMSTSARGSNIIDNAGSIGVLNTGESSQTVLINSGVIELITTGNSTEIKGTSHTQIINTGVIGQINTGVKSTNDIENYGDIGSIITGMGNSTTLSGWNNPDNVGGQGTILKSPFEEAFKEDPTTYQMIITLKNLWKAAKNKSDKDYYYACALKIRMLAHSSGYKYDLDPLPSFSIDNKQGIYFSPKSPIQKVLGYNDFFDTCFGAVCDMNTVKMMFGNWRIQFWKGNYLNMGIGAEMGIYVRSKGVLGELGQYSAADTLFSMPMSFALFDKDITGDETIPLFMRYDSSHWWLNGFMPGLDDAVPAENIRMIGSIAFKNKEVKNAFIKSIPSNVKYTVNGLRVDYDWK